MRTFCRDTDQPIVDEAALARLDAALALRSWDKGGRTDSALLEAAVTAARAADDLLTKVVSAVMDGVTCHLCRTEAQPAEGSRLPAGWERVARKPICAACRVEW